MPQQPSEPHREPARRSQTARTSPRTAIWNAVAALAIIAILFVTFYGLNTQRSAGPTATATATAPAPPPPQTTGQGGSQNEAAPTGERAR